MPKLNGNAIWFKVVGVSFVLLASAVAYGVLCGNVSHNTESIGKLQPKAEVHDRKIAVLEVRVEAILTGVEKIQDKLEIP